MTAINVKAFRGQVPRLSNRLIGANQAKTALNCKITAGRLDPLRGLTLVHTSLAASIKTIYRYRFNGIESWLVSPLVVDFLQSPTAQDSLGRFYFTGDGEPRMFTSAIGLTGPGPFPAAFFVLGVVPPTVAASLAVVGGGAPVESRAYVYTFKTRYSEESAPSPAVVVSGNANGSWNLSAMQTPPPNSGTVSNAVTIATNVVEVTLDTVYGLQPYEELTFAGVAGMTDLNGKRALLTVDALTNKVTVALNTVQVYSAGPDTWARVAPHNTTSMTRVIYRTVGTNTDYKRVAEIDATVTTYNDVVSGTLLGEAIPTLDSSTPPKNLHSPVALANGAFAGLAGNQLCFSEQYKPYSWPLANRYAFAGTGVATYATGNIVIVLTDDVPLVATATVPESASLGKIQGEAVAPCVAKLSVVDIGGGCAFAGPDGLYIATPGGARCITNELYRRDEWTLMKPATFKAAFFDKQYVAQHDIDGQAPKMFLLDISEPDSIVEVSELVNTVYRDKVDGALYVVKGQKIYKWDSDDTNRYLSYWASREYQIGAPLNFAVAQVHAEYSQIVPVSTAIFDANVALLANADNINGALESTPVNTYGLNASAIQEIPNQSARRVQFSLRVDGQIVFTKELNSSKPFKLPKGFKKEVQGFEITSSIPVYSVSMAQTEKELAQASQ